VGPLTVERVLPPGVFHFTIALVRQGNGAGGEMPGPSGSGVSYNRVPFHMIANDGNLMEHAVPYDGTLDLNANGNLLEHKGMLPEQGIAERYDIVVDFSKNGIVPGDRLSEPAMGSDPRSINPARCRESPWPTGCP
jgi:manganese oxidase